MISLIDTWRRHLWLWVLPLGFCVLNLLGVVFYSSAFAGQVERLEGRYQRANDRLAQIENEIVVVREFLDQVEGHKQLVQQLHRDRFQTEEQRFTRFLQEVKKLARQAGLKPMSLNYPKMAFGGHDLVRRNISFSVSGSYDQLRNFINFLELTEHFVTLNSVALGGGGDEGRRDPTLSIKLVMSTIFTTRRIAEPPVPEGGTS